MDQQVRKNREDINFNSQSQKIVTIRGGAKGYRSRKQKNDLRLKVRLLKSIAVKEREKIF